MKKEVGSGATRRAEESVPGLGACVSLETLRHLGGESLREGVSVSGWKLRECWEVRR